VPQLDPKAFGVILHASMDCYAHSNWVELGKTNLVDDGNGPWRLLHPGDNIGGVIVLEGYLTNNENVKNFLPYPTTLDFTNPKVPTVHFGKGSLPGLISGKLPSPYDPSQIKCPLSTPGHWDHFLFYTSGNTGLSKDKLGRFGYDAALDLAGKQVKHEWCRFVNLVRQSLAGDAGVSYE
jgi:hypothetical protein